MAWQRLCPGVYPKCPSALYGGSNTGLGNWVVGGWGDGGGGTLSWSVQKRLAPVRLCNPIASAVQLVQAQVRIRREEYKGTYLIGGGSVSWVVEATSRDVGFGHETVASKGPGMGGREHVPDSQTSLFFDHGTCP